MCKSHTESLYNKTMSFSIQGSAKSIVNTLFLEGNVKPMWWIAQLIGRVYNKKIFCHLNTPKFLNSFFYDFNILYCFLTSNVVKDAIFWHVGHFF